MLATTIAGVFSISAAAVFSFALLSKMVERMVSLSVGILLSTSLLHALPEAFESHADPRTLFAVLLGGLLAFFCLKKPQSCATRIIMKAMVMRMVMAMTRVKRDAPAG